MTLEEQLTQQLLRFQLPQQVLENLSFCLNNKASTVKGWVESLPATRINHTSVLLYKALPEISRLKTNPESRLDMLDALRPYIHQCIQGLAKDFLNKPLILPEGPLKAAVVAQALQKHMNNGYCVALRELSTKFKDGKSPDLKLEFACHRAITGFGLLLFRSHQLYTLIPHGLWRDFHNLFKIAELLKITDRPIEDPLLKDSKASTISQVYLRVLLLCCARPNQLQPSEVSLVYDALENWVQFGKLLPNGEQNPDNLFLTNLSADSGPMYKSRFMGSSQDDIREVDMKQLVIALDKQYRKGESSESDILVIPKHISAGLVDHLLRSWSITQQRSFDRQTRSDKVDVTIGLTNLHFHIANGMSFDEFIGEGDDEEIDLDAFSNDPWGVSASSDDDDNADGYPSHSVQAIDSSPGGYCIEWRDIVPGQVRAGDAIGLKEQGRHRWGLGVIRWIQQHREVTKMGIQLLAPKTTPYAAARELPGGDYGDYMRVLMLPELKAANQPATLLTANAPFQEYGRILLNNQGEVRQAQLSRRLFSTGSISQFSFRFLDEAAPQPAQTEEQVKGDTETEQNDFSSVWDD